MSNFSGTNLSEADIVNQSGDAALQFQRFPTELSVLDVFNTIKKHSAYDFLTNKHMAVNPDDCGDSAIASNQANNSSNVKLLAGSRLVRHATSNNNINNKKCFLSDLAVIK